MGWPYSLWEESSIFFNGASHVQRIEAPISRDKLLSVIRRPIYQSGTRVQKHYRAGDPGELPTETLPFGPPKKKARTSRFLRRLLLILLILQLPFIYKVCQSRELRQYLAQLPASKVPPVPFKDLRGTLHVHSAAGGHSLATYPEILEVARRLDYDYIIFTEHPREPEIFLKIVDPELTAIYGREETRDSYRYLTVGEHSIQVLTELSRLNQESPVIPPAVTALEIYNMHENAEQKQSLVQWINFLYHQLFYPDLFYFHLWDVQRGHVALWDSLLPSRKIAATAGNDAHQNVGIILQTAAGQRLFSLLVDPYEYTLRFVTNRVVLDPEEEVSQETILDAVAGGSSYIAFEGLADATGFSFHARAQGRSFPMGSTVPPGTTLVFQSPFPSRFQLYRNGSLEKELKGTRFAHPAREAGAYRVEVYLLEPPSLIEGKPWIISNPIYVRP